MDLFSQSNLIIVAVISVLFILLQVQVFMINKRRKQLFGQDAGDLEGILTKHGNNIKEIKDRLDELNLSLNSSIKLGKKSIHKIGIVRFNPFHDTGGDQSFAIALLDASENGIVISSIHAREGTRVYAKPIEKGESKHNLSLEENKAIKKAQENKNNTNTNTQ